MVSRSVSYTPSLRKVWVLWCPIRSIVEETSPFGGSRVDICCLPSRSRTIAYFRWIRDHILKLWRSTPAAPSKDLDRTIIVSWAVESRWQSMRRPWLWRGERASAVSPSAGGKRLHRRRKERLLTLSRCSCLRVAARANVLVFTS